MGYLGPSGLGVVRLSGQVQGLPRALVVVCCSCMGDEQAGTDLRSGYIDLAQLKGLQTRGCLAFKAESFLIQADLTPQARGFLRRDSPRTKGLDPAVEMDIHQMCTPTGIPLPQIC